VQILAGALMRHLGAGLAIPDFPTSFGRAVPSFTSVPIAVNFAHRVGAVIVASLVIYLAVRLRRFALVHPLRQLSTALLALVALQITLGAYTVWSGKHPVITSLHVMTGAATLALSLVTALTAHTVGWTARRSRAGALLASEAAA
jgi:cytochrome c oxidase assembly protein subunit 15